MIRVVISLSLIVCSLFVLAQNERACSSILNTADSIYFSNPDSAYTLANSAENCAKENSDLLSLAKAKSLQGRHLLLKSELEESNIKLNESFALYKDLNDYSGMAYILKLKAIVQKRFGNVAESIVMNNKALEHYKKANYFEGEINILLNLILDYIETNNFKKAEEAIRQIESHKNFLTEIDNYFLHQNKGLFFLKQNKIKKAISEFEESLTIAEKNKMIDSKITILKELGKAYRLNKNYIKSKELLRKSESLALENNLENELIDAYGELILLYNELNDYKEAFHLLSAQNHLKDKLLNLEKFNRISFLEKKLAITEKQKEIETERLKTENAKAQTQKLIYVLIIIGIILIFTFYLFIRMISFKNKIAVQNQKLEEQNSLVQLQKNILEVKQKEIIDSIQYAKRIQESLLPTNKYIEKQLQKIR